MSTAILMPLPAVVLRQTRRPSTYATKAFSSDEERWQDLGRVSAEEAATKLLFCQEPMREPLANGLEGVRVAYHRPDHSQVAMHHHDQVVPRQRPKTSELDLVWIPDDELDRQLMETAGCQVRIGREPNGRMSSMSPIGRHPLPFKRDLVRVMEEKLGYQADSTGSWPMVISGSASTSYDILPAKDRPVARMHLLLGKERLRSIDLRKTQAGDLRPYEQLLRAQSLGYDAAIFQDTLVSGGHGAITVTATALFDSSRSKLSRLTVPVHPFDWREGVPESPTLTPEFLAWHQGLAERSDINDARLEAQQYERAWVGSWQMGYSGNVEAQPFVKKDEGAYLAGYSVSQGGGEPNDCYLEGRHQNLADAREASKEGVSTWMSTT